MKSRAVIEVKKIPFPNTFLFLFLRSQFDSWVNLNRVCGSGAFLEGQGLFITTPPPVNNSPTDNNQFESPTNVRTTAELSWQNAATELNGNPLSAFHCLNSRMATRRDIQGWEVEGGGQARPHGAEQEWGTP